MRIAYIAAGAGGSYCGACTRDVITARTLLRMGHEVLLLPLYTPLTVDGADPSVDRVFLGGINAWLRERAGWIRWALPGAVRRLLDRPGLLRRVARYAVETRPEDLGAMTVSVLEGLEGRQAGELEELLRFLAERGPFDVVHLTNSLLIALAPAVRERLGVPVVCGLEGEETFVGRLGAPHSEEARALIREHARAVARFIAPAESYAEEMADFLAVPRSRVAVVRMGIDLEACRPAEERPTRPFRIGFMSRLSPAKGLDLLCEAFRILADRRSREEVVLAVAGQPAARGNRFWKRLRRGLARAGLLDRVDYLGALDASGKVEFLRGLSVFSVPSRYPERRAVAVLEAQACGVPVVLPRRAGYDEVVARTGGGVLVEPDDPFALAAGLERILDRPAEADRLARAGVDGVARHFSANQMAARTLEVYREVLSESGAGETGG